MRHTRIIDALLHDQPALPVHPRTGLRAIGIISGRPVWPVMGGSGDGAGAGDSGSSSGSGDQGDDGGGAGDAGDDGDGDGSGSGAEDRSKWTAAQWKAEAERRAEEADKWKTSSRKHEDRSKANAKAAKELGDLKRSQMTEQEQAVDQARSQAASESNAKWARKVVTAELRGRLSARLNDDNRTAALLAAVDPAAFLTEDGEDVDTAKVATWIDSVAPAASTTTTTARGGARMGQGRQPATGGTGVASGRDRYEEQRTRRRPATTTTS